MSLKAGLKKIIQNYNGATFTYGEFEEFCRRNGQRTETGTRRLRELVHCEDPEIEALTSRKGAVIGWAWKRVSYPSQVRMF